MGWRDLVVDIGPVRRHRDFRLLLAGRGINFLGSMITFVAVPFQVYELTGSTLSVGLVGLVEVVVLLPVAFLGGALADAVDRRSLVMRTDVGLLVCSALLAANAAMPDPQLWIVFVLAAASSGLDALQRPALEGRSPGWSTRAS